MRVSFAAGAVLGALVMAMPALTTPVLAQTTLRVVMHSDLKIIDPVWTQALITTNHANMVYETLFALDKTYNPQPQMLEKWSVSDDKLTWTFKLREGLTFHNGQAVEAEDAIASIQRWGKTHALGQKLVEAVASYDAVDARTFTLKLKESFGLVPYALASNMFVMPAAIAATPASEQIKEPIGSGPFMFKKDEWAPGNKVVYVKNPTYKPRAEPPNGMAGGRVVKVDRVEWIAMPEQQTAINALQAGEIDMIEAPSHDLLPLLEADKNIEILPANPLGAQYALRFNTLHPPFNNQMARQAVLMGLSQEPFLQAQVGDPRYYKLCKPLFDCGGPLESQAGLEGLVEGNVAKAKELLAQSGYDGTPVVIMAPTDIASLNRLPNVAKQQLEAIGFKVDLQSMDWQTLVGRRAKKEPPAQGGWNLFASSFDGVIIIDPTTHLLIYATCEKAYPGWPCDARIEELRGQYIREAEREKQKAIAVEIQKRAVEYGTYVPLGLRLQPSVRRKGVSGNITGTFFVLWNVEKKG